MNYINQVFDNISSYANLKSYSNKAVRKTSVILTEHSCIVKFKASCRAGDFNNDLQDLMQELNA